jgi:hypothetical protein
MSLAWREEKKGGLKAWSQAFLYRFRDSSQSEKGILPSTQVDKRMLGQDNAIVNQG